MVNFVIVEDNKFHMIRTKEIVLEFMMKNNFAFKIREVPIVDDKFYEMIKYGNAKQFIYILDFELGNTNAIDVARRIRKYDWKSPIIVFTVNGGMAYDTFKKRLQILDFVNKQYDAEKNLHELFEICFRMLKISKEFRVNTNKGTYCIDYTDIKYFCKDTTGRKSVIITDVAEYKIPLTLSQIKDLVDDTFVYTHKSYLVNRKRIHLLDWQTLDVNFDNGTSARLLSKTHKKELGELGLPFKQPPKVKFKKTNLKDKVGF